MFPKPITASHGLLPTPQAAHGFQDWGKGRPTQESSGVPPPRPRRGRLPLRDQGFQAGTRTRSAGRLAPLPPNAKELPAPDQAGPAGTPRALPASSSPLPADEESELPRTSAPLAPAPAPGATPGRDTKQNSHFSTSSDPPGSRARHPASSLSELRPLLGGICAGPPGTAEQPRALPPERGQGAGPREAPHRATCSTTGWTLPLSPTA